MIYETSIESKLISIFEGMEIETIFRRQKHKYYWIMVTSGLLGLFLLICKPPVIWALGISLFVFVICYVVDKKYDKSSRERYLEEFKDTRDKIKEVFPDKEDVELILDATKSALDRKSAFNFTLLGVCVSIIILLGDKIIDFGSITVRSDDAFWLASIADVPIISVILLVTFGAVSIYAFHAARLNRKHTNVAMLEAILLNWDQMITIEDKVISTEETSSETK